MSGDAPEPGEKGGRTPGFWTSVPGILTGVAALVTAVVGLLALFVEPGGRSADAPDAAQAAPPSDPGPEGEAAPTGQPQASTPTPTSLTAVVGPGEWLDLDTGTVGTSVPDAELAWVGSQLTFVTDRAARTDAADLASCERALESRSDAWVARDDLDGAAMCTVTSRGAMALVLLTAPDARDRVTVEITREP